MSNTKFTSFKDCKDMLEAYDRILSAFVSTGADDIIKENQVEAAQLLNSMKKAIVDLMKVKQRLYDLIEKGYE